MSLRIHMMSGTNFLIIQCSYHHHCGAARMAISCGLHQITSPVFQPQFIMPRVGADTIILLPPPEHQLDLADRIMTFWNVYVRDKQCAVMSGYAPALNEIPDGVVTVLPRPVEEYESVSRYSSLRP